MNTEYVKLTEAARKLSTHPDTLRYWVKLLEVETIKRGHARYILAETLGVLTIMANLIGEGVTASEAAARAKAEAPTDAKAIVSQAAHQGLVGMNDLPGRIQGLENAMMIMAETFRKEVGSLRGEIARLSEVNLALQRKLEPPPTAKTFSQPPTPVRAWHPPTVAVDPLEGTGFLERIWITFVQPEKLRRQVEN